MIDPALPLQDAIVAAGRAAGSAAAARIYDRVPTTKGVVPEALFPFASLGAMQVLNVGNSCGEEAEVFTSLDVWSRAVGYVEVKSVAADLVVALAAPMTVEGFRVVIQDVEDINYRREPDGLTSRAIIGLRYSLVPET